MKIVDPKVAIAMLNRSHDQIPPAMPDDPEVQVKSNISFSSPVNSAPMGPMGTASHVPQMVPPTIQSSQPHMQPPMTYPHHAPPMSSPHGALPPGPFGVDQNQPRGQGPPTSKRSIFSPM